MIAVAGCALGTLLGQTFLLLQAQDSLPLIASHLDIVLRAYPGNVGALGVLFYLIPAGYSAVSVPLRSRKLGRGSGPAGAAGPCGARPCPAESDGWLAVVGHLPDRSSPSFVSQHLLCDAAGRRGVDTFLYRHMMVAMARAATTSDAFNAIAEPQRREILVLLQGGERPVTELARDLGMTQPQASKHLRVLREVGLVRVRGAGKQRLYGLDARGLRPVHEWLGGFERFWSGSFDRLDEYVQDLKQARREEPPDGDDQ